MLSGKLGGATDGNAASQWDSRVVVHASSSTSNLPRHAWVSS